MWAVSAHARGVSLRQILLVRRSATAICIALKLRVLVKGRQAALHSGLWVCEVKRSATQVAGAMWGGTGRTFNRAADGAGDHQQWSGQTRGDPSQELAARYAASAGLVGPAPTAAAPPAAMPPGVAFAPSLLGHQVEPPWVMQQRMQNEEAARQAAQQAQQQQT